MLKIGDKVPDMELDAFNFGTIAFVET